MAIEITRPGKNSLILETPVMPAAGTVGFGDVYRSLVQFEKLGAFVTNPVTYCTLAACYRHESCWAGRRDVDLYRAAESGLEQGAG